MESKTRGAATRAEQKLRLSGEGNARVSKGRAGLLCEGGLAVCKSGSFWEGCWQEENSGGRGGFGREGGAKAGERREEGVDRRRRAGAEKTRKRACKGTLLY